MTLDLHLLLPEMVVAAAILAAVAIEAALPAGSRRGPASLAAGLSLLVALGMLLLDPPRGTALAVADTARPGLHVTAWRSDAFAVFARALAALGGLLVVMLSVPYARRMDRGHGEFYALLLLSVLGVMLVSGVSDLLSLFLCLELVTIHSYVLASLRRNDPASTEAGLKYLVVGALSTAILLLGIAFVYGATGSVSFEAIASRVAAGSSPLLGVGLVLLVVGLLFKVGGVPFHVWIPDVYQGAPAPVVGFLSTGSKAAGLVLLVRLAEAVFLPSASAASAVPWAAILGVVAAVTLVFGILGAVPQRSIRRLFGYSSIGHAGYLLMGVAAAAAGGEGAARSATTAILFYLLAFAFTNLTAFAVIVLVGARGKEEGSVWTGLSRRSPFLALAMLLALLSLAGVPPLSGFFGKFLILRSLVENGSYGFLVLAFVAAAGVVVSLYFYLAWIAEMYLKPPPEAAAAEPPPRVDLWGGAVLAIGIAAMLGMGIWQGPFFDWAADAAASVRDLSATDLGGHPR
jgi:NADH-quinone oxidoreductase subunit N